jgi:pimeloyl-ACP methyl ester carboxylesterase
VADDFAELLGRLELGPVRICTLTSGARFGLALAERLGPQVVGVLMLSPRLPPSGAGPPSASPMVRFRNRIARNLWVLDSLMAVMRLRLTRPLIERITLASAIAPGDAAFLRARPAVIDTLFEAMRETWLQTSDGTTDELRCLAAETHYDPGQISAPVEIWHGAEDTYAPPDAVAAHYGVPPERLRVVGGIGSYLVLKHWGEVLASLAEGPRQGYSV